MPQSKFASILRLSILAVVVLAVSVVAGSPFAGVGLVVGQVLAGPLASGLIALVLVAAYLLEGRDATLPLTLVASRTFIVGTWLLSLAMLWFVTLAVTPQAYEVTVAVFSIGLTIGRYAHRQWKEGCFWPARTGGHLEKLVAHLRDMFAAIDRLAA